MPAERWYSPVSLNLRFKEILHPLGWEFIVSLAITRPSIMLKATSRDNCTKGLSAKWILSSESLALKFSSGSIPLWFTMSRPR